VGRSDRLNFERAPLPPLGLRPVPLQLLQGKNCELCPSLSTLGRLSAPMATSSVRPIRLTQQEIACRGAVLISLGSNRLLASHQPPLAWDEAPSFNAQAGLA